MLYIIGIIILILLVGGFIIFLKVSKLNDIKKALDICAANINEFLNKKLELINILLKDIDNKKIKKDFSYSDDFNIYEKEEALFNVSWNIYKYIKDNNITKLKDKAKELNVLEENLDGLKDFYNANVLNYNEVFLKKSFNKIFRIFKFGDYKSFKIRKLEEYEIFKN